MSTINTRIKLKRDTTANWNNARGFVPMEGELIIYLDYQKESKQEIDSEGNPVYDSEGNPVEEQVLIPGIKVGDGKAYVQDLPFIDQDLRALVGDHIANELIHVTTKEKEFWNNKVNINDSGEHITYDSEGEPQDYQLDGEKLIFTRKTF